MERVATLINKLKDQLDKGASAHSLLITVEMLQSELLHKRPASASNGTSRVAVIMPSGMNISQTKHEPEPEPLIPAPVQRKVPVEIIPEEPKTIEILQVDESEIEAELEEIKRNAEMKNQMSIQNKPASLFDQMEEYNDDIPTLTHQRRQTTAS
ncbi:MAG: hypothetical protein ABIQ56_04205, partial [Chitinophagaceae bacterium]